MWSGEVWPRSPHSFRNASRRSRTSGLVPWPVSWRDKENRRRAFHTLKIGIAFEFETFLDQLGFGAKRRLQLPAMRRAGGRRRKRGSLRIVIAIVSGQRQIEHVQRPLLHVFPNAQRSNLIRRQAGQASRGPTTFPRRSRQRPNGPDCAARCSRRPRRPSRIRAARCAGVDLIALLDRGERFKDIRFAGVVIRGPVPAAEEVERDLSVIGDGRFGLDLGSVANKGTGIRDSCCCARASRCRGAWASVPS